jgi:hypothetical protein
VRRNRKGTLFIMTVTDSDPLFEAAHMAVYYIGAYDIDDVEKFKRYPSIVASLLPKLRRRGSRIRYPGVRRGGEAPDDECDHQVSVARGSAGPVQ